MTAARPRTPPNPHQPPRLRERATYAHWVRARVRKVGSMWHLEVTNTHTGEVLVSDNCAAWAPLRDEADHTVGVVRWAAFYGLAKKRATR